MKIGNEKLNIGEGMTSYETNTYTCNFEIYDICCFINAMKAFFCLSSGFEK